MYKKILFGSFIAVFIAGGIYWYMYFQDVKAPISDAINCIPENAALIIESKQSKNTWKKLSQTNIMWEELLTSQVFYEMDAAANRIDSILDANPGISKLLDGQSVYISAHSISNNSYHFLFTYSLPNLTHQAEIEDLMMKLNKGEKPAYRAFDNYKIGTLKTSASNFLNFCLINGTMLLSSDELLVQEAVKQVNSGKSLIQNAHFKAILNSSGKNVDANIFLNYKLFPSILKNFTNVSISDEIAAFSNFAQYSGWDVSIKPNALMLNGFTYVNDSSNNYLKLFRNQKPQNIEVINVAPSKTAMMLFCGISNFKAYLNDYKLYKKETAQTAIEGFNEKYNANIGTIFSDWFDNEMALIITESNAADFREHAFAYLHSNDVTEAMLALNALADSVSINDSIKTDTLTFKNHFINKISITGFLPHLLGWQFNKIEANYFTSVDNYIVFGNSIASLQTIINDFENSKTLANNKNYIAFAENISNQANVYFYSSMSKSSSFYSSFLNDEQAQNLRAKNELLKKFEAVAFQFSSGEKLFYSNGYIKYNPAYKKEVETIWETKISFAFVL